MAKKKKGRNPNQQNYHQSANSKKERVDELRKKYEQRVNSISEEDLEYAKAQIDTLFSEANMRIEMIKSQGLTSFAIERIESESGRDYFDTDVITDRQSLMKELYRVRVFLNDSGSTRDGALLETAQINGEEYKGKFGNQYNTEEHNYKRFDTKVIREELAQRAFESYRKIEKTRAGEIALQGGYGSENLIIALYDAEVRGRDSLVYGTSLMDAFVKQHEDMWNDTIGNVDEVSSITGLVYDNLRGRRIF